MPPPMRDADVTVAAYDAELPGILTIPERAVGLVVFAHGSGSSRFSSRNRAVARDLNGAGLGTLLFDLLTEHENEIDARTAHLRFDITLLSDRLIGAVEWTSEDEATAGLPIGLFGASTGAAAAIRAAADRPELVRAVVSRGGRPDLAGDALDRLDAPTLLIVGGADTQVIDLNEAAARSMARAEHRTEIVAGATHLFEEPGALEQVSRLAREWFLDHLRGAEAARPGHGAGTESGTPGAGR